MYCPHKMGQFNKRSAGGFEKMCFGEKLVTFPLYSYWLILSAGIALYRYRLTRIAVLISSLLMDAVFLGESRKI